jgi:hypothetical protein
VASLPVPAVEHSALAAKPAAAGTALSGQVFPGFTSSTYPTRNLGLTIDTSGNFYYVTTSCRIVKVTLAGVASIFAGNGSCGTPGGDGGSATSAELGEPAGLGYANGYLFIADLGLIRRVNLSTNVIDTLANLANSGPWAGGTINHIAVDSIGSNANIYFDNEADRNAEIDKVNQAGTMSVVIPAATSPFNYINGLSYVSGNLLISAQGPNRVVRANLTTGLQTTVPGR